MKRIDQIRKDIKNHYKGAGFMQKRIDKMTDKEILLLAHQIKNNKKD